MRKSHMMVAAGLVCMTLLGGCGGEKDTAVIVKDQAAQTTVEETQAEDTEQEAVQAVAGYAFAADGIDLVPDMDMKDVLAVLGDADSYFEAPSCAFEGLDKVYTYSDFEVDTYPKGEQDLISAIILKSDLVSTAEGVAIGGSIEDIEAAYGSDYEEENGMICFAKDDMKLKFIVTADKITSIEYDSTAADAQ